MQNTGIAAVMPQGAQQATPAIPQNMQPRPQGGVSTGIAPSLGGMDKRTLAMAVLGQVPGVEPAAALGQLNKVVESEKMQQAMAGQQAMAQNAAMQQQPPVAQQVLMQALNSGIGAQPQQFASGGLVAFADGGLTENPFPAEGQELQRLGMQFGISLSPYDSPGVRAEKIARIKQMVAFNNQMQENRAEIPTPDSEANRAALGQAYGDMSRRQDVVPKLPPQAAPMPPKPPAPPRPGASPRAAAPMAPTVSATPDELTESRKAYLESLGKSADLTPEETFRRAELRKQLEDLQKTRLARQEKLEADLAARRAAMGQRPSGFQDPDFLLKLAAAMGGTKTFSEGLSKAAEAASGYGAGRRKEQEEAAREMRREEMDLMKLREATEDLKTALYEKDLAYASGGANAKRAADLKVAEARANMANADREFKLKERDTRTRERAVDVSAAARGEARNTLTPHQIAQIRSKAKDSITKDKNYQMKVMDARNAAKKQGVPFDSDAWLNQLVDNEMQEVARAMGYELPSTGSASASASRSSSVNLSPADQALINKYLK